MNAVKKAFQKLTESMGSGGKGGPSLPNMGPLAVLGALGLALYGGSQSLVTIKPGHLGVLYTRYGGIDEHKKLSEGLNIIIPWFQRAIVYDARTRPQQINSHSGSKDLQMVQITLRILYKPSPNQLPHLYRALGTDYDERVLPSIVNEVTKAIVAQYNASELLTKREQVSREIRNALVKRAGDFFILLDDVSITHLAFSKEYTAAVEAKQVALQESQRARYLVEKALQEKKTIIVKAEGEARSAELIGGAINKNPAFLQLRRIDAAREVASTVQGMQGKVYLDADNLLLNHLGEVTNMNNKSNSSGWFS